MHRLPAKVCVTIRPARAAGVAPAGTADDWQRVGRHHFICRAAFAAWKVKQPEPVRGSSWWQWLTGLLGQ